MKTERQKFIHSIIAIAISVTAVWYSTKNVPEKSRSTASFTSIGSCFNALKKIIKNYDVKVGADVVVITHEGITYEGKIHSYARGGFQINNSKGAYLVSFGHVKSINDEILNEMEIYKKLLEQDVRKIQDKSAIVRFHTGDKFASINGRDFEMGEDTLNFTNLEDGRRMTFAYEKIYGIKVIDPAKEAKRIRYDARLHEGEFVTVELKSGENLDGIISLSSDGSRIEVTDIEDSRDIMAVPVTDVKSIYQ